MIALRLLKEGCAIVQPAVHARKGTAKCMRGNYELTMVVVLEMETAPIVRADCLNAFLIILTAD